MCLCRGPCQHSHRTGHLPLLQHQQQQQVSVGVVGAPAQSNTRKQCIRAQNAHPHTPSCITAPAASATHRHRVVTGGPVSAEISYAVLVGFGLPDPSSGANQALIPASLLSSAAADKPILVLQDVRILVDAATLKRHAEFFSVQPGVMTYTVGLRRRQGVGREQRHVVDKLVLTPGANLHVLP